MGRDSRELIILSHELSEVITKRRVNEGNLIKINKEGKIDIIVTYSEANLV